MGISLRCVAGKILVRVLAEGFIYNLEQGLLQERQCGVRQGQGTTDMIFLLLHSPAPLFTPLGVEGI